MTGFVYIVICVCLSNCGCQPQMKFTAAAATTSTCLTLLRRLVLSETEEELIKRLNEWKENVESKGMRVNMNKTKVMISGERQMVWQKAARWPCGVCNKGVGSNSLQCTRCQKWVHKKCRVACRK